MRFKAMTTGCALALMSGAALTLALNTGVASMSASERNGDLHVTKECSQDQGLAGDHCTITSSNFAAIKVGSKVFYDQAVGIPADLLDSNVVLDAGNGNRAVGRCTLDLTTGLGLCTFSDGLGRFAGFHAVSMSTAGRDADGMGRTTSRSSIEIDRDQTDHSLCHKKHR